MKVYLRLVCAFLAVVLLCGTFPVPQAEAVSGTIKGTNLQWNFNSGTGVLTISGTGKIELEDHSVDAPWYSYRYQIKKVIIQPGVTWIGKYAFYDSAQLEAVVIPDSVTLIGEYAFSRCSSLKSVQLPKKLHILGGNAFEYCTSLTSVEIPGSIKNLTARPFTCCTSLTSLTLNEGLEEIGDEAFRGLPITSITIPSTVKIIGKSAFAYSALTQVRFSEGLERIEANAFEATRLREVELPASLKFIGDEAFYTSYDPNRLEKVVVRSKDVYYSTSPYHVSGNKTFGNALVYSYLGSTTHSLSLEHPFFTFQPIYFTDVQPNRWYYEAVRYARENGLFNGVTDTEFAPDATMTRAMAVTVLYRYAKSNNLLSSTGKQPKDFSDVPSGRWFSKAVAWASANGVVNGVSRDRFDPDAPLTREQLVTILRRFASLAGDDVSAQADLSGYTDQGQISSYARAAMAWAVKAKIISGVTDTQLSPAGSATRAQVATILMRYVEKVRAAQHPQLYVYADKAQLPTLTLAAEEYGKKHPELTIHVGQATATEFYQSYLLDGKRDFFLARFDIDDTNLHGYYCRDCEWYPLHDDQLHMAVAPGDPKGIGTAENLVTLLRQNTVTIGTLSNTVVCNDHPQNYMIDILEFAGMTYDEVNTLSFRDFKTTEQLAAAVADGTVDVGTCWNKEIVKYGLTALPEIDYPDYVSEGGYFHYVCNAFLLVSSSRYSRASAFYKWIAAHMDQFE